MGRMAFELFEIPESVAMERLNGLGFSNAGGALRNLKLLASTPLGGRLASVIKLAKGAPSPDSALNNLEAVIKGRDTRSLSGFLKDEKNLGRLITITGSSPFLSGILAREPGFFNWLFCSGGINEKKSFPVFNGELRAVTEGGGDFDAFARALRVYRQKEFLRLGARDLLGLAPMEEITGELSDLADAFLEAACGYSLKTLKREYGVPYCTDDGGARTEAEFVVIGLGKLGGRELNYSSDIDIMYIYSSDNGETAGVEGAAGSRISLNEFFLKAAVRLRRLLSDVTSDGIVFRIDLDLRPGGGGGDMVNSLRSVEVYYESWGQAWERAALIKARTAAGSRALGEQFLDLVRPFVYRRYLDFTAIEEIKTMKEKIDLSLMRRNPDAVDVKLGAGGIREIEFFCQALQLIHGGKDREIRQRATVDAVKSLRAKNLVKEKDASVLLSSYVFLRNLEHRIQIVEMRQTQAIPSGAKEIARLARMMGFMKTEEFREEYSKVTSSVHGVFVSLFYRSEKPPEISREISILFSPDMEKAEAMKRLSALGFKESGPAYNNLELLRDGPRSLRLSARARVLFGRLAPVFLAGVLGSPDPDMSLKHLEAFISRLGARTIFYSLLLENPKVTEELLKLFGTSVFLSRSIIEHPENLDLLLSDKLSIPYKSKKTLMDEFASESLDPEKDYGQRIDAMRRLKSQEVLRIGINDAAGVLSARQVSTEITFLAETCLDLAWRVGLEEVARIYGTPEDAEFSILGLGKLGGRELIYGSDLDIVFVYSAPGGAEETFGVKNISPHEFFVKLCQRVISILTVKTAEGFLFNVDTRLRPSGSSGPIVVTEESLLKYHQKGSTSVWERQAFIRARAVAGDSGLGKRVVEKLGEIIFSRTLKKEEALEMLRIRRRMEEELALENAERYNIKTGTGGAVDIEFLVQALQLKWGGEKRGLKTPVTLKALKRLFKEGLVKEDDYRLLREAYLFYRLLVMKLRVVHDRPEGFLSRDPAELDSLARSAGYEGGSPGGDLLGDYERYRRGVRKIYSKVLGSLS